MSRTVTTATKAKPTTVTARAKPTVNPPRASTSPTLGPARHPAGKANQHAHAGLASLGRQDLSQRPTVTAHHPHSDQRPWPKRKRQRPCRESAADRATRLEPKTYGHPTDRATSAQANPHHTSTTPSLRSGSRLRSFLPSATAQTDATAFGDRPDVKASLRSAKRQKPKHHQPAKPNIKSAFGTSAKSAFGRSSLRHF